MKIHTIQVHIGDLVGGTIHMDNAEFGAYWALVMCCYQSKDHTLPNDDSRLARMAKCTPREWQKVKAVVLEKFTVSDSKLSQKRVDEDVVSYQEKSQRNRANALKRHNPDLPVASQSHSQTPAIQDPRPKTHNINKKDNTNVLSKKAHKPSRAEFEQDDLKSMDDWFAQNAPGVDRHLLRRKMIDWLDANGRTYKDHHAALRSWATKEQERINQNGNRHSNKNPGELTGHAALGELHQRASDQVEQDKLSGKVYKTAFDDYPFGETVPPAPRH